MGRTQRVGSVRMKAIVWHDKENIRHYPVFDPSLEDRWDAKIKGGRCAICKPDLHLFDDLIPAVLAGDITGHESMGEVVEVGDAAKGPLKKGERDRCCRDNASVCERTNRKDRLSDKAAGHRMVGLFGHTHDPSFVLAAEVALARDPELSRTFRDKADGCGEAMLRP